jgi:hypothetical protein
MADMDICCCVPTFPEDLLLVILGPTGSFSNCCVQPHGIRASLVILGRLVGPPVAVLGACVTSDVVQ